MTKEAFLSKVEITNGCWNWKGYRNKHGYGRLDIKGKHLSAHRVGYELLVGKIPEGLTIDHLCRNTSCVNPNHLEPVTMLENIMRGNGVGVRNKAKTSCSKGHLYTEENTYYRPGSNKTEKDCRICKKERNQRSNQIFNARKKNRRRALRTQFKV